MRKRLSDFERDRLRAMRAAAEFDGWPDSALLTLVSQFDELELAPGTRIAVEGRPAGEYVLVLQGHLQACSSRGLTSLGPGASVGWDAMWDGGANPATVTVIDRARVLVMGHAQFRAVKAAAPLRPAVQEVGSDQLPAAV